MNVRRLTESENAHVSMLAERLLHISAQIKPLMAMPVDELEFGLHSVLGVPNWRACVLLLECAGWVEQEMSEALS
jgi:hypothetical protein